MRRIATTASNCSGSSTSRRTSGFRAPTSPPPSHLIMTSGAGRLRPRRVGTGVSALDVQDHFDRARAAGLRSVPHAGETTGPETIWEAITDLGAERIEHGITAVHDQELLGYLAEHQIALDVCPTSNVALKVVDHLDQHPIRELVGGGRAGDREQRRSADVRDRPEP